MSDRYLKAILTVIALELLWIGVKDLGTPLAAQATPQVVTAQPSASPMPVIIRGVEIDGAVRGAVPVHGTTTFMVDVNGPVKIEADQPIRVDFERPVLVRSVPAEPARVPGE